MFATVCLWTLICLCLFVRPLVCLFIHLFFCLFVRSCVCVCVCAREKLRGITLHLKKKYNKSYESPSDMTSALHVPVKTNAYYETEVFGQWWFWLVREQQKPFYRTQIFLISRITYEFGGRGMLHSSPEQGRGEVKWWYRKLEWYRTIQDPSRSVVTMRPATASCRLPLKWPVDPWLSPFSFLRWNVPKKTWPSPIGFFKYSLPLKRIPQWWTGTLVVASSTKNRQSTA